MRNKSEIKNTKIKASHCLSATHFNICKPRYADNKETNDEARSN